MLRSIKQFAKSILRPMLRLAPLDGTLSLVQRTASLIGGLILLRDWTLQAYGWPQFFKHRINLARWDAEPHRWSFVARGVYAREKMFRGCSVLDLCCGDGTYSRLFFSDIASRIDAVDVDDLGLQYARRYNSASVITYHRINIVEQPLPGAQYDFVVWNAAVCYFDLGEIKAILAKIVRAGQPGMQLCGMLPKATGYIDHKTEFAEAMMVAALLKEFFTSVAVREIDEISAVTFYFSATGPRLLSA